MKWLKNFVNEERKLIGHLSGLTIKSTYSAGEL